MPRQTETGARPHRSAPVHVVPSSLIAAAVASAPGGVLGGSAARQMPEILRDACSPRCLAILMGYATTAIAGRAESEAAKS